MLWDKKKRQVLSLAAAMLMLFTGCASKGSSGNGDILREDAGAPKKDPTVFEVTNEDIVKHGSMDLYGDYTMKQSLCAPEDDIYFEEFLAERGDTVKKGEHIARFSYLSSEAELKAAELELKRAEEDREEELEERQKDINNSYYGGSLQTELARLRYEKADYLTQRRIDQLKKTVEEKREEFEPVYLDAPYDCVISSLTYIYEKQRMWKDSVVADICNEDSFCLIGTEGSSSIRYGNDVTVEYGANSDRKTVNGRVVCTSRVLGRDDRYVWIVPDEPMDITLTMRIVAEADIPQLTGALTVPVSAIKDENGSSYVEILSDGVPHKRYIMRGIIVGTMGETRALVIDGLEEGQLVIKS